jgi:hypothetical protein
VCTPVSADQLAMKTIRGCLGSFLYFVESSVSKSMIRYRGASTKHVKNAASNSDALIQGSIRRGGKIGCVRRSKFRFAR